MPAANRTLFLSFLLRVLPSFYVSDHKQPSYWSLKSSNHASFPSLRPKLSRLREFSVCNKTPRKLISMSSDRLGNKTVSSRLFVVPRGNSLTVTNRHEITVYYYPGNSSVTHEITKNR